MKELGQSYAQKARDELLRVELKEDSEQRAQLCALVQVLGSLIIGAGTLSLRLSTENAALARFLYAQLKARTGATPTLMTKANKRLNQRDTVNVDIEGHDVVLPLLETLGVYQQGTLTRELPDYAKRTGARRAYLRGLFLACGSITNPSVAYHLEWVFKEEQMAQNAQVLLAMLDIDGQIIRRKTNYVVYLKEGDSVARALVHMGAHAAMMDMENARILHQVNNDVNRAVNCETANVRRTVDASMHQVACIRFLAEQGMMARLSPGLRQAADARLTYPEASLPELAAMMSPPTSKSGINHRLRRLCELAVGAGFKGQA